MSDELPAAPPAPPSAAPPPVPAQQPSAATQQSPVPEPFPAAQPFPAGQPFPGGGPAFPVGQPFPTGQPFPGGGPAFPAGQPYQAGQPFAAAGQTFQAGQPYPPAPPSAGIPAQRSPMWPEVAAPVYPPSPYPPSPFHPAMAAAVAAERTSSRRALFVAAALFLALALVGTVGIVIFAAGRAAVSATSPPGALNAKATPATPFDTASAALDAHATALINGDEAGWLAAVDPAQPKLRTRYRSMYASLRGLGVSQFAYHPFIRPADDTAPTTVSMGVDITYCFSMDACPGYSESSEWIGAPRISQSLTLKPVDGRYVITYAGEATEPNHLQPTPWESGDLVFAQGKRVTVAAPKNESSHLAEVVAVADKAAQVNDRFAAYVDNPQKRYRIYLADAKAWRTWYGGETNKWIVGYSMPLNEAESDVVLQTSQLLGDKELMATTIQHELGHVVTLGGVHGGDNDKDLWLIEGIAEYIGWSPRPATASWRRPSVRAAVRGAHPPKTIAAKPLADNASAQTGDAFYGLGHFAVDCMAQKFGQRKMFNFVKLTLREGYGYDQASQEAFGKPFTTVDKSCVSWIRQEA